MEAPSFALKEVVTAALEKASEIASGTVTKAAAVVFALLLAVHLIQGGAEFASRTRCRFFDSRWWLRLVLVVALLAGYRSIVVQVAMRQVPAQMLAYTTSWAVVWSEEWDAIDALRKNDNENKQLRQTEMEQKNNTTAAGSSSWSSVSDAIERAVMMVLDSAVSILGGVISAVVGLGLCLLMLVQAFWVLGILLLLVAIGPLCIVFAFHEVTASIFWAYFRQVLVYQFLYLPFLGIACSIAGVVMGRVSSTFVGSGIEHGDGTDVAVHLLSAVLGPVLSFAVVKGAPAALMKIFGGGDSGETGAQAAGQMKERALSLGKNLAVLALGGGGGGGEGGGPVASTADSASSGGDNKITGDSARGAS
jgi:hypothetical protein